MDNYSAVQYIGKMHDAFFSQLDAIDSTKMEDSTLNSKLKSSFIVYTTIGSRLFKATTRSLNIKINGGILSCNGVSAPVSELRIILVGENPYGEGKSIVYAAGSTRLLNGINGCFHGPSSYHIFQGDRLLKEGFYDKQSMRNAQ